MFLFRHQCPDTVAIDTDIVDVATDRVIIGVGIPKSVAGCFSDEFSFRFSRDV